ncbi:LysR substrate-binding domain-containing protein [Caballeronia sp. INDeC2]|uniref:LysR substrate-binding domain-containing protein n=1 Tax=Caballeronia sp. INDeC2 TaxID=2921747 RepID=UPI0020298C54|nr:LysR substrate-binding domain-containing protein [Caballeronia sp. INDeC2]
MRKHLSHAATQLNGSPSQVTRYDGNSEPHLSVRMLHRPTRKAVLTEIGVSNADGCRVLLRYLEIESLTARAPSIVAADLNVVVLHSVKSVKLAGLFLEHRSRCLEVSRNIALIESQVGPLGGGFDADIVADAIFISASTVSRTLVRAPQIAAASPGYLLNTAAPCRPLALATHRLAALTTGSRTNQWTRRNGAIDATPIDTSITLSSILMQRQFGHAGGGIALLPKHVVANDLRMGTLICLLGHHPIVNDGATVALVYLGREFLTGTGRRVRRSGRRTLQTAVARHAATSGNRPCVKRRLVDRECATTSARIALALSKVWTARVLNGGSNNRFFHVCIGIS